MSDMALVLGGGGVAGVAWITGVIAGLADEGIDLRDAQRILGTSAGATVGAQLWSGASLEELFARQADPAHQMPELSPPFAALRSLYRATQDMAQVGDPDERVRRICRMALDGSVISEAERRAIIAGRLPSHAWPAKHFVTTALDAETGALRLFDAASGANLVDAVAASCAVPMIWPATTIQGRRYVDGGMRSFENADLIVDARSVVILSPSGVSAPSLRGTCLRNEVDGLEVNGARVAVIEPDTAARTAIGNNALDPATRTPCADAGRAQGRHEANRLRALLR
jgi:NTE family protein